MSEPTATTPSEEGLAIQLEAELNTTKRRYDPWVSVNGLRMRLTAAVAAQWSNGLLMLAAHARYQAALIAQGRELSARTPSVADEDGPGYGMQMAVAVLEQMRAKLPTVALGPLTVNAEVRAPLGEPVLLLAHHGVRIGVWSPAEAELHALHVLQTLRMAACDTAYLRFLVGDVGVDLPVATNVIHDLTPHHQRIEAATELLVPGEEPGQHAGPIEPRGDGA